MSNLEESKLNISSGTEVSPDVVSDVTPVQTDSMMNSDVSIGAVPVQDVQTASVVQTVNQVPDSNQTPVAQAWDKDSVIRMATEDYIASLTRPIKCSNEDLRNGLTNAIIDAINERNVVQGGTKVQTIQGLPNPCIASLILAKYHVRCISWTGNRDDGNFVGVYQEDGNEKGIYISSDAYFNQLIRNFKFTATKKDVDEILEILEADAEFVKPSTDPDLLAFNNGIFNYKTKELLDFNPDIAFTRKSKVNYISTPLPNPHITMPDGVVWDFDSWMESLSDDPEIVELLLKTCGAVIRPNVRWDKIVCMYSQVGMNGKGTLCELMKQLCGDGFYASIPFVGFEKDSMIAQLIKANAVITDENGTNDYAKNVANLKALTTGDSVSIDRKYKDAITFKYNGLIVECVNNLPRAADQTDSFYRRFLMIPFEKTFKGEERKYIKNDYLKRPEVLEYVLQKVMNLPEYYELPEPEACKKLLDYYKEYNDPVLQFVDETFPCFVWEKVPQSFVYDCYLGWCAKNNPSGKTIGKFGVMDRIRSYVLSAYADEWQFKQGDTRINKNDNLAPELLIVDYGLDDWRSKTYKGTDPAKMSMPQFKKSYNNCFLKVNPQGGTVSSDSEEED